MLLNDSLASILRLKEDHKIALKKLGLETVRDLLYHFPARYADISKISSIRDARAGETVTLVVKVLKAETKKAWKRKIPMAEATLEDASGKLKAIWFNQAYIAKMLPIGKTVTLTGRITESPSGLYLANAEFDKGTVLPTDSHDSLFGGNTDGAHIPVYPESRGVTSRFLHHSILKILASHVLKTVPDPIPEFILKKYSLPSIDTAMHWLHAPRKTKDAIAARKRFAFEEVFFIQLGKARDRKLLESIPTQQVVVDKKETDTFIKRFGFPLTGAQQCSIDTIFQDFISGKPMSRLLEGDVGSGKTAVAAATAFAVATSRPDKKSFGNLQIAYMAPTEILATQHFESFTHLFKHMPIQIGLLTGKTARKFPSKVNPSGWTDISRAQLLKWVANGEIPILIGTHTLIQKSVKFKHLSYVIIDEQHRFGTAQRMKLAKKEGLAPHLLSMTATPIPRTLALTIYGDLDLTLLDEMPAGRKSVITEIIRPDKRDDVYEKIRTELEAGRQLYVICPRINEPDPSKELALQAKSVTAEAKRLKEKVFPEYKIDILHSKMSKQKKEDVMQSFASKETDILVATSVVEVGVNVPNATVIIIEGAERFGLAQLHQLRGRVIRSNHQAYCYLFAESKTAATLDRLKALVTAKNGFELAELDLTLRGAGELGGGKQWGITDIGMEAIKNIKMVEAAREEAKSLVESGKLADFPILESLIVDRSKDLHFE